MSVLNAFASFILPQIASLFPLIDGKPVDRIMVAATYGGPTTVTLITRSGKEVGAERVLLWWAIGTGRGATLTPSSNKGVGTE